MTRNPILKLFFHAPAEDRDRISAYTRFWLRQIPFCWIARPCLIHSLILYGFLKPAHPELRIIFGVQPGDGTRRVHGHCWTDLGGKPLYDSHQNTSTYEVVWSAS